jgi:hypothetical protein
VRRRAERLYERRVGTVCVQQEAVAQQSEV